MLKLFKKSVVDLIFKDNKVLLTVLNFWVKFWVNISKFRLNQKLHEISFFGPLLLNLPEVHTQKPLTQSL